MSNLGTTEDFFNRWDGYHDLVSDLDTYKLIAKVLPGEIRGRLLDVGNGGVFNYDTRSADEIVVVDIAKDLVNKTNWPPHVTFRWGDAAKLPVESNEFDTVLLQLILHHLAEDTYAVSRRRVSQAIQEAHRVLKPGGRLVIVESCLPAIWEQAERACLPLFRLALRLMKHPLVFQWNWKTLARLAGEAGFQGLECHPVPLGRWVIQLGHKWPTILSPIRVYKITGQKPVSPS